MAVLEIYDPPMCCSSGVCGPAVNPALITFAADLEWLQGKGVEVRRFNLAQEPAAFAANPLVKEKLAVSLIACLPMILLDDRLMSHSVYPSRRELAVWAGVEYEPPAAPAGLDLPMAGGGSQCGC